MEKSNKRFEEERNLKVEINTEEASKGNLSKNEVSNDSWNKENKFKAFFSIQKIAVIGMMLSLIIVSRLIEKIIPDLPNGLGNISNLLEIFILIFALTFGPINTLIAISIYIFGIAWLAPHLFLGGVFWVKGTSTAAAVYFLDYVFPIMVLVVPGFLVNKEKIWMTLLLVVLATFCNYVIHVSSGIIFWSSYAWKGWGPVTYSFAGNGLKFVSLLVLSLAVTPLAVFRLKDKMQNTFFKA